MRGTWNSPSLSDYLDTVMVAEADFVASAMLVAVTVSVVAVSSLAT